MLEERGINILGYINKQFGLGEGVRSNIRSIQASKIPFVLNDFKAQISKDIMDEDTSGHTIVDENPYSINLIQINVDNFDKLVNTNDKSYFTNKYNIGFWAWELEKFPNYFQQYFDLLDEIWVPSNFCLNAISQVSTKPVLRFMHSIDIPQNNISRKEFNLPTDKLIFLTIFDYHSTVQRKNPYATIKAFQQAFGNDDSEAILIIKTSIGQDFPSVKSKLREYIKDKVNIIIIDEILPREMLYGLMSVSDVYISLHRSEGFGLTMAEAMALGKPVIATGYSANTEFMNSDTSFLVRYQLVPTNSDYLYPDLDNVWADADVNEASKIMRHLADNPGLRKEIGERAQNHISNILSPSNIGDKIKNRMNFIYDNCIPTLNNSDQQTIFNLQHENTVLKTKVEALRNIKAVQWKLSFKNWKNKVTGKSRKYIWED